MLGSFQVLGGDGKPRPHPDGGSLYWVIRGEVACRQRIREKARQAELEETPEIGGEEDREGGKGGQEGGLLELHAPADGAPAGLGGDGGTSQGQEDGDHPGS